MAYSSISCCYVSTKHIAYFLSSFLCLFSLFPYLYVGVPWPWAHRYRWACLKNSTTTSTLESVLYLFTLICHFIVHVVLWHVYVNFLWTCVVMLCFDNGSVHHLVVGSEPTHCDGYLSLCILHIDACCILPFEAWHFMVYVLIIAFIALLSAGLCSRA